MLFALGQVVMTNGVGARMMEDEGFEGEVKKSLLRHMLGDWGNLDSSDKKMNDQAVKSGEDRIVSKYNLTGDSIYIITEWDRSVTTILFPSEY